MNRCIAFTKNKKKCRGKCPPGEFFCSESHRPLNYNTITECCPLCVDTIETPKELYYFHCKHVVHKKCYNNWMPYSTYENPVCIFCRQNVFEHLKKKDYKPEPKPKSNRLYNCYVSPKNITYDNIDNITQILFP